MLIGDHDSGLYAMNNGNGCFADIRKVLSGGKLSDKDKDILKQMLTRYYRLLLLYNLRNPLRDNNVLFTKIEEGYIGLIKNCIYPKEQVFRVEDSNSDNGFLKIPKMQVRDSDDKKNSDRSTEEMKKFEFEKNSDYETINGESFKSDSFYIYLPKNGFIESSDVDNLLFSGKDLICIKNRDFSERNTRIALKKLFKVIVDSLLNGRTLKSRALYSQFLMVK